MQSVCSACLVAANPKPEIKTTKTNSISQESGGQRGMNSHLGTRKEKKKKKTLSLPVPANPMRGNLDTPLSIFQSAFTSISQTQFLG